MARRQIRDIGEVFNTPVASPVNAFSPKGRPLVDNTVAKGLAALSKTFAETQFIKFQKQLQEGQVEAEKAVDLPEVQQIVQKLETIEDPQKKEEVLRKGFSDLVKSGKIGPQDNPYTALFLTQSLGRKAARKLEEKTLEAIPKASVVFEDGTPADASAVFQSTVQEVSNEFSNVLADPIAKKEFDSRLVKIKENFENSVTKLQTKNKLDLIQRKQEEVLSETFSDYFITDDDSDLQEVFKDIVSSGIPNPREFIVDVGVNVALKLSYTDPEKALEAVDKLGSLKVGTARVSKDPKFSIALTELKKKINDREEELLRSQLNKKRLKRQQILDGATKQFSKLALEALENGESLSATLEGYIDLLRVSDVAGDDLGIVTLELTDFAQKLSQTVSETPEEVKKNIVRLLSDDPLTAKTYLRQQLDTGNISARDFEIYSARADQKAEALVNLKSDPIYSQEEQNLSSLLPLTELSPSQQSNVNKILSVGLSDIRDRIQEFDINNPDASILERQRFIRQQFGELVNNTAPVIEKENERRRQVLTRIREKLQQRKDITQELIDNSDLLKENELSVFAQQNVSVRDTSDLLRSPLITDAKNQIFTTIANLPNLQTVEQAFLRSKAEGILNERAAALAKESLDLFNSDADRERYIENGLRQFIETNMTPERLSSEIEGLRNLNKQFSNKSSADSFRNTFKTEGRQSLDRTAFVDGIVNDIALSEDLRDAYVELITSDKPDIKKFKEEYESYITNLATLDISDDQYESTVIDSLKVYGVSTDAIITGEFLVLAPEKIKKIEKNIERLRRVNEFYARPGFLRTDKNIVDVEKVRNRSTIKLLKGDKKTIPISPFQVPIGNSYNELIELKETRPDLWNIMLERLNVKNESNFLEAQRDLHEIYHSKKFGVKFNREQVIGDNL